MADLQCGRGIAEQTLLFFCELLTKWCHLRLGTINPEFEEF